MSKLKVDILSEGERGIEFISLAPMTAFSLGESAARYVKLHEHGVLMIRDGSDRDVLAVPTSIPARALCYPLKTEVVIRITP